MTQKVNTAEFDPNYVETFENSHELYTEMRSQCPVAHSDAFGGFWALFRYDDVVRVQEESDEFITSRQNTVPKISFTGRRPPLHFDPPEHADFRRPLDPVFRRGSLSRLRPILTEYGRELLAPLVASGGGDFVGAFALHFAARAFGELLGLPTEFMLRVRAVSMEYQLAIQAMDHENVRATSLRLYDIAGEIYDERSSQPIGDPTKDVVSALLAAETANGPLNREMIIACIRQMLPAAQAAPQAVMGSIAAHLARDPELQAKLRANRKLIPTAVEEFLRMYAPYRVFARTARHDVELGGRKIPAGEPIAMIFASANRDEAIFEDPHTFRLDRKPNRHISFGRGPHRCVASHLARLELEVALGLLLDCPTFVAEDEPVMGSWLEFGPIEMRLKFNS